MEGGKDDKQVLATSMPLISQLSKWFKHHKFSRDIDLFYEMEMSSVSSDGVKNECPVHIFSPTSLSLSL